MIKIWIRRVLSVVAVAGMVNAAQATLLMQDDFEGVPATSVYSVTNGTTCYPDGMKWVLQNQDPKSIAVYTDATANSQVLCLQKASSSVPIIKTDFVSLQKTVVSFDLYVPSSNQNQRTMNLNLQDATNAANVRTASYIAINNGSNGWGICSIAGGGWKTIVTPKVDQWATVTINADAVSKTFTLTYDGMTYNNNGNGYQFFDWTDGLSFNRLFFSSSGAGLAIRLDNVKVVDATTPPEPTAPTVALKDNFEGVSSASVFPAPDGQTYFPSSTIWTMIESEDQSLWSTDASAMVVYNSSTGVPVYEGNQSLLDFR